MSNDQSYPLHEAFLRVLNETKTQLGSERTESIKSTLYATEPEEAFKELVCSLRYINYNATDAMRKDLKALAKGLSLLDFEQGKGHYW